MRLPHFVIQVGEVHSHLVPPRTADVNIHTMFEM